MASGKNCLSSKGEGCLYFPLKRDKIQWSMSLFKTSWKKKELIVFDLDGTLAPSKSPMRSDMSRVLGRLLATKKVAVIGGGRYEQFKKQLIGSLRVPAPLLARLFLFPTSSTTFYRYQRNAWRKVYSHPLTQSEKKKIFTAFKKVFKEIDYRHPQKIYGKVIEDRNAQVSFSPLGQEIVTKLGMRGVRLKEEWKRKHNPLRLKMAKLLQKHLPEFLVRVGGITTIDITRKGIDKGYGVRQIERVLKVPIRKMLFVGDALYPGGNDHAARKTGVECVQVNDPKETKKLIQKIIA